MRRHAHALAVLIALLLLPLAGVALTMPTVTRATLAADGTCHVLTVRDGQTLHDETVDPSVCSQYDPTATPVPPTATTAPSPTATGCPGVDDLHWHPPVVNGCATGHEHGLEPYQWVKDSRWMPMFTHPGNTPGEAQTKQRSCKGFGFRDDGVDVYLIMHLDTNPNGHTSRFHSVQVWARDATGAVSHWDYWLDFGHGNDTGPYLQPVDSCGNDGSRPIMMVNFAGGCPGLAYEHWYGRANVASWTWDLGFNVQAQYYAGPTKGVYTDGDLANSANWLPTGQLNATRRVEGSWYADRDRHRGTFYATQFGDVVSGPTDPICGAQRTFGAKSYQVLCLEQFISSSLTTVQFPGNSVQKTWPTEGVHLPN